MEVSHMDLLGGHFYLDNPAHKIMHPVRLNVAVLQRDTLLLVAPLEQYTRSHMIYCRYEIIGHSRFTGQICLLSSASQHDALSL